MKNDKRNYQRPLLQKICLDKNISLVMMSVPPGDPSIGKLHEQNNGMQQPDQHFI